MYTFTIEGHIVPYFRMTQRGKFVKPRAQEYLASKDAIGWQLKERMASQDWAAFAGGIPLGTIIAIDRKRSDARLTVFPLPESQADHRAKRRPRQ